MRIPGMFSTPEYETVGAVCVFRAALVQDRLEYQCICVANPKALQTCAIPPSVAANLSNWVSRTREA